jgi:hypothetical protein
MENKWLSLLTSRKLWAALIGVLLLALPLLAPGLELDEEALTGLVVTLAAYIVGVAVEGGAPFTDQPLAKLRALLGSRKFWAAAVSLAVVTLQAFDPRFPMTAEQVTPLVSLLAAYIVGTAVEDRGKSLFARGAAEGAEK